MEVSQMGETREWFWLGVGVDEKCRKEWLEAQQIDTQFWEWVDSQVGMLSQGPRI